MRKTTDFSHLDVDTKHHPSRLFPHCEESGELSVRCFRSDFSASRIARAVEDVDAHILNMNVTSEVTPLGEVIVDLRVSHRNVTAVAHSLERYGYEVHHIGSETTGNDAENEVTASRIAELMVHLKV
ncbi:MAG: hypothetical protein K2K08_05415 [Paramuribaculum sp.]|nr:hypothetical protein [Paramuribaculum sp.]